MTIKRESIIDKIKALLSKTTANGATEHEMMSALDKASAMMDAYDITDEEVQLTKEEAVMEHADPPDLQDAHNIKWRMTYSVGEFCNVQFYLSAQPVDATQALNLSAGVSNVKVLRGRSLS